MSAFPRLPLVRHVLMIAVASLLPLVIASNVEAAPPPNVVLIMIDDMGYGDLSCHGSPFVETPNIDGLHDSSVRLTNFHVAPMCSPTRGQLMTGMDAMRNGSTIVAGSRMMVRRDVPMLPAHLAAAGYATGLFGKWHLGENYPHRPEDRGFEHVLWFPLQEIGSFSDHWCNDYFDPVFRLGRGRTQRFIGYCTDIFFDEAIRWMTEQKEAKKPFFCYLPLNVVHGPQWANADLRGSIGKRFPNLSPGQIGYLAMLANADANMGKLEAFLREHGLSENTIVIFLSDNGGYALIGHYNAGMRDGKSRLAEGGHRVPCFVRWPGGRIGLPGGARNVDGLTQVQDLLPTLLDLCGVAPLKGPPCDGISLASALRGEVPVPDRTLIVQYGPPQPFHMTCVMQGPWRLLTDRKGKAFGAPELYHLTDDPRQEHNLIERHPERAAKMRAVYDAWWSAVEPQTRQRARIIVGHPAQKTTTLNAAEWRENALGSIDRLREGVRRRGVWDIEVSESGVYEIALRRWPAESQLPLRSAAPPWTPRDASTPDHQGYAAGLALPIRSAQLRVGQKTESMAVADEDQAAIFRMELERGKTELEGLFLKSDAKPICAAFFVSVQRIK
ncbi:MAG: arylsulfatase [Planctomycetota bacterium]